MKVFWACLLISVTAWAHSQTVPKPDNAAQSHLSIADFGLIYPLSNDWVRATELLRRRLESSNSANFDILLAGVFVPKSNLSATSPFFSLRAYRQPATDCKKNLETMIAHSQDKKDRPEGGVEEFSTAGRDYFRVNFARGVGGRHQCVICTTGPTTICWSGMRARLTRKDWTRLWLLSTRSQFCLSEVRQNPRNRPGRKMWTWKGCPQSHL